MPNFSPPSLSIAEILAYQVQDIGEGLSRQRYVVIEHPAALGELYATQFSPHLWPEYAGHSPGELLHLTLPSLQRRYNSPEMWRSRQWLLPPQRQAAETLSYHLHAEGAGLVSGLPGTFSVPVLEDGPLLPLPPRASGWLGHLFQRLAGVFSGQAKPVPPEPQRVLMPPQGTQAALLAAPVVQTLLQALQENLCQAEQSEDGAWRYHAKTALLVYLPETLRLHGERGGQSSDPDFVQALANIRAIATAGAESERRRWEAHQRFLEEKARSLG